MIDFSDGLRHRYLQGLNKVSYDLDEGINSWLNAGKDYFVAQDQGSNDFTITTYDLNDFYTPYAYDINRLSCASLESLNDISTNSITPKFLGWIITKYYYSAFFSAHSILRIMGNCLTNIDAQSINQIRAITRNYSFTYGALNTGQYCVTVNTANNSFNFSKNKRYDNSHEGLWLKFLDFLSSIGSSVFSNLPQNEAQTVIDKIAELKDALTNWNSYNGHWLSRIRNQVNYSQNYGTWYPYKNHHKEFDKVILFQNLCRNNPLEIEIASYKGKELLYFVRTCQLINAMCFNLIRDLAERHPKDKSFLKNGVFKYHKLYLKGGLLMPQV